MQSDKIYVMDFIKKNKLVSYAIVILIISIVILVLMGTGALRITDYMKEEANSKLEKTAQAYSADINAKFAHMSETTDIVVATVKNEFDVSSYNNAPDAYIDEYSRNISGTLKGIMKETEEISGIYVMFDETYTDSPKEIWYTRKGEKIERTYADLSRMKAERNLETRDTEYFFNSLKSDKGVWTGLYYDGNLDQDVFSYSRSIYKNGQLIAVVGTDITQKDSIGILNNKNEYPEGQIAILDEYDKYVVKQDTLESYEAKAVRKQLKSTLRNSPDLKSGFMSFSVKDTPCVAGFSVLDNGWRFVLMEDSSVAYSTEQRLEHLMLILTGILLLVVIILVLTFLVPVERKNEILEKSVTEKEVMLAYKSRQARTGEMIGNVAHQWKQPLNNINLITANLLDSYQYGELDEEEMKKSIDKIMDITHVMSETISDFSEYLKPEDEKIVFPVKENILRAVSLMEASIKNNRIYVEVSGSEDINAYGFENDVLHVFFNILDNARDAIIEAGDTTRKIDVQISESNGCAQIKIYNSGNPLTEEVEEHVFQAYYSTKGKNGTGLGLYICKKLIEGRMGGKITLANEEHCGENNICCTIILPMSAEEQNE